MRGAVLTVATSRYEPVSAQMLTLARSIAADNGHSTVEVVEVDIDTAPQKAVAAGAVVCPTVIVEVHPHAPVRMEGIRSRRAILHVLLPLLHDHDTALAELRRQLDSPGETFPRRATRRTTKIGQRSRIEMLGAVPLFEALSKRQLKDLAAASHEVVVDEAIELIRQGSDGDEFFAVVDGQVEVSRNEALVDRLGPGDYFGEMSLLDDGPRTASVSTVGPATLLAIDRGTFRALVESSPHVALALLGTLAGRLRDG